MLAVSLFTVGLVEYLLAALWTRAVVTRRAAATGVVTFVNVMLWGFVITSLEPGEPWLLVIHGAGCAVGAAAACRISSERLELSAPTEAQRVVPTSPRRRRSPSTSSSTETSVGTRV